MTLAIIAIGELADSGLVMLIILALLAVVSLLSWLVRDANARGLLGLAIALIVLLSPPVGLLLYLLFRPRDNESPL